MFDGTSARAQGTPRSGEMVYFSRVWAHRLGEDDGEEDRVRLRAVLCHNGVEVLVQVEDEAHLVDVVGSGTGGG